jgi:hypothetical protein
MMATTHAIKTKNVLLREDDSAMAGLRPRTEGRLIGMLARKLEKKAHARAQGFANDLPPFKLDRQPTRKKGKPH